MLRLRWIVLLIVSAHSCSGTGTRIASARLQSSFQKRSGARRPRTLIEQDDLESESRSVMPMVLRPLATLFIALRNSAFAWQKASCSSAWNMLRAPAAMGRITNWRKANANVALHEDMGSLSRSLPEAFRQLFSESRSRHAGSTMKLNAQNVSLQEDVRNALSTVSDRELINLERPDDPADIVTLGLVRRWGVSETGKLALEVEIPYDVQLTGGGDRIGALCDAKLQELSWVTEVDVQVFLRKDPEKSKDISSLESVAASLNDAQPDDIKVDAVQVEPGVSDVDHIVAVASCKGGVGKSTTTVNLAYALSAIGKRVGIVDLDIHGSSLPTMVKPDGKLEIVGEALTPLEAHGVKLMSMGFLNPGAMPMRGVRLSPIVKQLIGRTRWGKLDYLVVDMPPGTGDIQLTLSQDFKVNAAVLVTTPQRLSFVDVVKGVEMFHKVAIPTIAVVENMNGVAPTHLTQRAEEFIAKHGLSEEAASELQEMIGTPQRIFGEGHVRQLKQMWGINTSFSLPLVPELASSSESGVPLVVSEPDGELASIYSELAKAVDKEVTGLGTRKVPEIMYSETENQVLVAAVDGSIRRMTPLELRKLCVSPLNDLDNIPADVAPINILSMGNYAVQVFWNDGHQSLLPYDSFVQFAQVATA